MYHQAGDKNESMDCGCGDILGVIGMRLEGAEISDDRDRRRRIPDALAARPHAVYTSEQMLEFDPKTAIFRHFSGPSVRLAAGNTRSATLCSIVRSDTTRGRSGHRRTAWRGFTETAISKFADCSLSQLTHIRPRPARALRQLTVNGQRRAVSRWRRRISEE